MANATPERSVGALVLGAVIAGTIYTAIVAWIFMLLLGAVHSFAPAVPALSYWQSLIILMFIRTTTLIIKSVKA